SVYFQFETVVTIQHYEHAMDNLPSITIRVLQVDVRNDSKILELSQFQKIRQVLITPTKGAKSIPSTEMRTFYRDTLLWSSLSNTEKDSIVNSLNSQDFINGCL